MDDTDCQNFQDQVIQIFHNPMRRQVRFLKPLKYGNDHMILSQP
jgi:hypothetical protein